jgi:hypothetical protein
VTPVEEAKELMMLVATPSALVTGTFLAFAGRAIKENEAKVDHARMWFAFAASLAAVGVTAALTLLLAPLALRVGWEYQGNLKAVLIVYWMITVSVAGSFVYSVWTVIRCIREFGRPSR